MQSRVCVREKRRNCSNPVFTFSYSYSYFSSHQIFLTLLALDTEHLQVPVIHEDAQKYLNLTYSFRRNTNFVSPMYKTYPNATILLQDCIYTCLVFMKPAAFFRTVEHFSTSYICSTL